MIAPPVEIWSGAQGGLSAPLEEKTAGARCRAVYSAPVRRKESWG